MKISANQLNGDVLNTDSTTLVSQMIPYGSAHKILMAPAPGFTYKGVILKHGYNLDGPQFVKDNMQWKTDTIDASKFKDNIYTIPASSINGEVRVEGLFDIDTGIQRIENGESTTDNGQSPAVNDQYAYDLSGRPLPSSSPKGIYIQGGRKLLKQ